MGVTLHTFEGKEGTFFRFLRADVVEKSLKQLLRQLKNEEIEELECRSNSSHNSTEEPNKRRKLTL